MNRYSELEVKYSASQVPVAKYKQAMKKLFDGQIERQHTVVGWDTFLANPDTGLVLRYRRAKEDGNDHPVLTYKKRKSPGQDSVDRHEVDLFLEKNAYTEEDALAFAAALGCRRHFDLLKESYIYHVRGDVAAIIAMYDVMVPTNSPPDAAAYGFLYGSGVYRFLEIEIDKESLCGQEAGQDHLARSQADLEATLPIGKPIGKSLYELIGPTVGDSTLFIPGTF